MAEVVLGIPVLAGAVICGGIGLAAFQSLHRSEGIVSAMWLLALLASLAIMIRNFKRLAQGNQIVGASLAAVAPVSRDESLSKTAGVIAFDPAEAPRSLTRNPWHGGDPVLTIDQRVRIAIEASLRHSRVLGVICLQAFAPGRCEIAEEQLHKVLRSRLRRTDHVEISTAGDIVEAIVYVPLLRQRTDLEKIAERLRLAVAEMEDNCGVMQVLRPGIALNPIDGYAHADLVAAARLNMSGERFCLTGASKLPLPAPLPKR